MSTRILVVDDDASLAEMIGIMLESESYTPTLCHDGAKALDAFHEVNPDLVLLDLMLPGLDGVEICRLIRSESDVPIIMLTARTDTQDVVAGLEAGADDYVTKPFSMEEVMIRLHRLVQRSGVAAIDDAELVVGDLVLNQDTREVTRGGEQINLTATQFDLLRYLMENAKRVVSKSQILDNVWNYDFGGQANIVELYISYLRKKIDVGREPMIHTVRGAGYVLRPAV